MVHFLSNGAELALASVASRGILPLPRRRFTHHFRFTSASFTPPFDARPSSPPLCTAVTAAPAPTTSPAAASPGALLPASPLALENLRGGPTDTPPTCCRVLAAASVAGRERWSRRRGGRRTRQRPTRTAPNDRAPPPPTHARRRQRIKGQSVASSAKVPRVPCVRGKPGGGLADVQKTYGKGKHHARLGPHGRSWVIPCVGGRHPTTFPAELGSTSGLCARQAQARPAPGMDTHIGLFFLSLCRCFLWVEVGEASAGRGRRRSPLASVARPRRARRAGERRRGEERRGGPRATGGAACSPVRVMRYVCLGVTSRARERKDCSGGVLSIACSF